MTASNAIYVNAQISIPRGEVRFTFVRSSGPGGQNVNKVASKAVLRWLPGESGALSEAVRRRFIAKNARRLNDRGELILSSQRYRDQGRNIDDCLEKLRCLVAAAAIVPVKRKKTHVPKRASEARLKQKRVKSERKRNRGSSSFDD